MDKEKEKEIFDEYDNSYVQISQKEYKQLLLASFKSVTPLEVFAKTFIDLLISKEHIKVDSMDSITLDNGYKILSLVENIIDFGQEEVKEYILDKYKEVN